MTKSDHLRSGALVARWRRATLLLALVACWVLGAGASPPVFAQGDQCSSLIVNGGFENGNTGWIIQTNNQYDIIADVTKIPVHRGTHAAYLGGVNNASDRIATTLLALPADAPAMLTFWWQIETEESGAGVDSMTVSVVSPIGTPLQTLATYTDLDADTPAFRLVAFDLSAFAGQIIQIRFAVETDTNLETDFLVDDVALSPCGATVFLPFSQRE